MATGNGLVNGSNDALPEKMMAAVYQKAGEPMVLKEIPLPSIGSNELLVKLVAASLCRSDLVPYQGWMGRKTEGLAGGHEGVGIVVAVGPLVNSFVIGDRVGFLNTLRTCNNCRPCLARENQFCESGKVNQGFDTDGFFAQYAAVQANFAVPIEEGLPMERLSPLFCAGITAFRAAKQLGAPSQGIIGVFGLGGVGLFAVQFAMAMGFRVIGCDVSNTALKEAKIRGAIEVIDSSKVEELKEVVGRLTNTNGLDGAIVCSGAEAAYSAAITHTGFNGTIVMVGVPQAGLKIDVVSMVKKGLKLQATQTGNPLELRQMMSMVKEHNIMPEVELSTLEHLPRLMQTLASGQATGKMGVLFS